MKRQRQSDSLKNSIYARKIGMFSKIETDFVESVRRLRQTSCPAQSKIKNLSLVRLCLKINLKLFLNPSENPSEILLVNMQ